MRKSLARCMPVVIFLLVIAAPLSVSAMDKQQFCQSYASQAVQQYEQGVRRHLPGIVPPVWSNDRNVHYRWCLGTPEKIVNGETTRRQAYLDSYTHSGNPAASNAKAKGHLNSGMSAVAATPISIPRPIKTGHPKVGGAVQAQKPVPDIREAKLVAMDGNRVRIRFSYKNGSPDGPEMYGGAFLYDLARKPIDVSYTPTRPFRGAAGTVDVELIMPATAFQAATLETFILCSGKIVERQFFKMPFVWTGTWGSVVRPSRITKGGQQHQGGILPVAKKVAGAPQALAGKMVGKIDPALKQFTPISFDPGLGP